MKQFEITKPSDLAAAISKLQTDARYAFQQGLPALFLAISRDSLEQRSNEQNRLLWPLLNDFSQQLEHFGNKYSNEQWKDILSAGFEGATQYAPNLDGTGLIAFGVRTSKYSKKKFSEFIEFIYAEGVTRGVTFSEKSGQAMSEVRG